MAATDNTAGTIRFTLEAGLARVTLARPDALNACNGAMRAELRAAFEAIAADATVRAVLLDAEGRHFCVGQDLDEHLASLGRDRNNAMAIVGSEYNPMVRALAAIRVPIVAAVRGACAGAGWSLALAADIRIASERTTFRSAFASIGLTADSGFSLALTRAVGPSRAMGIILLDEKIDAAQAQAWGLVHRVVEDAALDEAALALAREFAAGPTRAFVAAKALVDAQAGLDAALEREREAQEALGASDDHLAAVEAFLAKRKPVFTGR